MSLKNLLEAIVNPFFLLLLLLAASTLAIFLNKARRSTPYSVLFVLIGLVLLSTGFLPNKLIIYLESQYPPVSKLDTSVSWIVVLGGGQANLENTLPNNRLYSASIKRLLEGVRLYRQLPNAKLLLSGGHDGSGKTEAENLSELASWIRISPENIFLENKSANTIGQVKEIKPWVGKKPFYLVTSAVHMPRAITLCKRMGLNPIGAPTDFTLYWADDRWTKYFLPNPNNIVYFNMAWHEILGIIWAKHQF
jgi:uncharacterized SAM-binding protein YcdF (DUF218 family)